MIRAFICLLAALLCAAFVLAQERVKLPPIPIEELNTRPVIGKLGVPLGTVVEIQAVVVSGRELRRKADSSSYLLKITHVNGKRLHESRVMHFTVYSFVRVKLANDTFALHELKYGTKAKSLGHDFIQEMEQGYVGKSFRLAVYEEGAFRGIPSDMPEDALPWQDVSFGFRTSLNILADRNSPEKEGSE